jgi:diguanylate cyclase (GGDEF)-like protein/PAS domain S-box-containing protein
MNRRLVKGLVMKRLRVAIKRIGKTKLTNIPALLGSVLIILAMLVEFFIRDMQFSWENLLLIQASTPCVWLFESALLAYLIYVFYYRRVRPLSEYDGLEDKTTSDFEKNSFFKAVFQHSPSPMVVLDPDHRILMSNQSFEELFGYNNDETVGRNLDFLISDPNQLSEAKRLTELVRDGKTIHHETLRRKKDGSLIDVEILGVPVMVNGQMSAMMAIYNDISSQRKAEKALKESVMYYQSLFENSPISLWELDFSNVKALLMNLQFTRIPDFTEFFKNNHDFLQLCLSQIVVNNVNHAALELVGATNKNEFYQVWPMIRESLEDILLANNFILSQDGKTYEYEINLPTLSGEAVFGRVKFVVAPGHESDWSKVYTSVENLTGHKRAEEQMVKAYEMLEVQATKDPLTDLPNRRELMALIHTQREQVIQKKTILAFAILDLDHLKSINDNHGHNVGDIALRRFAESLRNSCREEDYVGRWGGDEFVLIAQIDSPDRMNQIMERVHKNITETKLALPNGNEINLRISIGATYSSYEELEILTLENLIDRADQALYQAKGQGRNQIVCSWESEQMKYWRYN